MEVYNIILAVKNFKQERKKICKNANIKTQAVNLKSKDNNKISYLHVSPLYFHLINIEVDVRNYPYSFTTI